MILGIGIDSVEVNRFLEWHTKPHDYLSRFFTDGEIAYCMSAPIKSAERFAVRFAAKEALLKALSAAYPHREFALFTICRASEVISADNRPPKFSVAWEALSVDSIPAHVHISLTHTDLAATAFVILEK